MDKVTAADLQKEVKAYNWGLLVEGDPGAAERAVEKARVWLRTKLIQAESQANENDEAVRLIITKRALYELYSAAEQEAVAAQHKEDALELLKARFGSSIDGAGYEHGGSYQQTPIAVGAFRCSKSNSKSKLGL